MTMSDAETVTQEETDLQRLADYVLGTPTSTFVAVEILGIDDDQDWDDKLLNLNVERCGGCGWWSESCMLEFVERKNAGFCDQCKDERGF
jgi:hypothetical protein